MYRYYCKHTNTRSKNILRGNNYIFIYIFGNTNEEKKRSDDDDRVATPIPKYYIIHNKRRRGQGTHYSIRP